ncbi:MAG TPA: hypothetical protein VFO49_08545 [Nocardioides sp.]|nr:hypothetical protein [Nocardioides sp.]
MANDNGLDIRAEVVGLLLEKVTSDTYPSGTMLDMIELLASPEERDTYAQVLMDKVMSNKYPSIPMMRRLLALS